MWLQIWVKWEMGGIVPSAKTPAERSKHANFDNMPYRASIETGIVAFR